MIVPISNKNKKIVCKFAVVILAVYDLYTYVAYSCSNLMKTWACVGEQFAVETVLGDICRLIRPTQQCLSPSEKSQSVIWRDGVKPEAKSA